MFPSKCFTHNISFLICVVKPVPTYQKYDICYHKSQMFFEINSIEEPAAKIKKIVSAYPSLGLGHPDASDERAMCAKNNSAKFKRQIPAGKPHQQLYFARAGCSPSSLNHSLLSHFIESGIH